MGRDRIQVAYHSGSVSRWSVPVLLGRYERPTMQILLNHHSYDSSLLNGRAVHYDRANMGSPFKIRMVDYRHRSSNKPSTSNKAMESKELIIAVVTILGSGAAFKFYENVIKNKRESERELRKEAREENPETMFRDDLLKRVNEMSSSLEVAQSEILRLTQKVAELETENRYLQREIDILKRA